MHVKILSALIPLTVLAACSPKTEETSSPPAVDADAIMAQIHKTEDAQIAALNAGDIERGTAIYAPGAWFYPPGEPGVTGPAIRTSFERMLADANNGIKVDEASRKHWVAASGDIAATSLAGTWKHTAAGGKVVTEPMANQTVWQKQADGSWKIMSDLNAIVDEKAE
jgi:ketosteroid isomerase-like protein